MFVYNPACPRDMRFAILRTSDPVGKKLLRSAKRAALAKWRLGAYDKEKLSLKKALSSLTTGDLNHLAVMHMISANWQGATGEGGIWAMASDIVNETAREVLAGRSAFEVIEGSI